MNAIFAGMCTTQLLVIPIMESNLEQPLKTFPRIGYALFAELLSLTFHPATRVAVVKNGEVCTFPFFYPAPL